MERYDYREAMREDICNYIREGVDLGDWRGKRCELEEALYDQLWITDSVTGNASGSYYCNAWSAEEAIAHNWDLLEDALRELCGAENPIEMGAEWCDVTIRCYLLGECISDVLDDLEDELEELDEEGETC
jgi:hypothetical protein